MGQEVRYPRRGLYLMVRPSPSSRLFLVRSHPLCGLLRRSTGVACLGTLGGWAVQAGDSGGLLVCIVLVPHRPHGDPT